MENKRRFPRLSMSLRIDYKILDSSCDIRRAKTTDVSVGGLGLCISTGDELLAKGTYLDIKFYLPKEENAIEAIARVAWSRKTASGNCEAGLEFVKISYEDQERIANFMSKETERQD